MAKTDPDDSASSAPKRTGIVDELRRRIARGEFKPGTRLPIRTKLEKELKASRATVQQAFDILKNEGFIVSRRKRGTFVAKRPPHLTCYGLVFPTDPKRAWRESEAIVPIEAEKVAKQRDCRLIVYRNVDPDYGAGDHARLLSDMRAHRLAGIILHHWPPPLKDAPVLYEVDVPQVVMAVRDTTTRPLPPHIVWVRDNYSLCLENAVKWLASKGVRRLALIHHIGLPDQNMAVIRRQAEAHGMTIDPLWTQYVERAGAHNLIALLMRLPSHERPDGMFIGDPDLVNAVSTGLVSAGARVGQDIHVIAFATFPLREPTPLPFERIGWDVRNTLRACMDIIDSQRRGEKPQTNILMPPIFESEVQ